MCGEWIALVGGRAREAGEDDVEINCLRSKITGTKQKSICDASRRASKLLIIGNERVFFRKISASSIPSPGPWCWSSSHTCTRSGVCFLVNSMRRTLFRRPKVIGTEFFASIYCSAARQRGFCLPSARRAPVCRRSSSGRANTYRRRRRSCMRTKFIGLRLHNYIV